MLVANGSHLPPSPKACPWLKETLSPGETGHLHQGQPTASNQLKVYVYRREGGLCNSPAPSPLSSTISVPSLRSSPWGRAEARPILKPHLCPAPSPGPLCFPHSLPHAVPLSGWLVSRSYLHKIPISGSASKETNLDTHQTKSETLLCHFYNSFGSLFSLSINIQIFEDFFFFLSFFF